MATTSPRITITLDQGDYDTLKRLAELQGVPMSKIIREFVRETGPVLERLAETLTIARRAESTAAMRFRESAEEAERRLKPLADMVRNQFDMFVEDEQGRLLVAEERARKKSA